MKESSVPSCYENFKLWIKRNGCKMDPRVVIAPQDTCIGLSTTSPIPPKTTIIAVPQKLILTVEKCYNGELRKLFESNDDLFNYEDSDDAEFNVLAVFIMYEKSKIIKGRRQSPQQQFFSFWQPYIESVQQGETAMDWSNQQLQGLYDEFREEVEHFKKEIESMEYKVVAFLLKREEFAGLTQTELKDLFNYGYKFVMTRCFGYSTPSTSLIPLADLMNHSCEAIDHQLINTKRQLQPQTEQYTQHSNKIDMSLLGLGFNPSNSSYSAITSYISEYTGMPIQDAQKLKRTERQQQVLKINSKQPRKMLSLNYFSSSDEEDNDTDSQDEEMREQEMDFLRQQEKEQMTLFSHMPNSVTIVNYKTAQQKLAQIQKKQNDKQKELKNNQHQCQSQAHRNRQQQKQQIQKKWPVAEQTKNDLSQGVDNPKIMKIETRQQNLIQQAIQRKHFNQDKVQSFSHRLESVKFRNELQNSNSSEYSSDQQEYKWFKQPGTYFLISTDRSLQSGQPIYNCYGRRTNKFLLIWYGFCYSNNLFDSVSFRFYVNFSLQKSLDKLIFEHYYGGKGLIRGFSRQGGEVIHSNQISKEFRLKKSKLCQRLMTFLRLFLMNQYKGEDMRKLFATFPTSFEYQIFILSFMEHLVLELQKRYSEELIKKWKLSNNQRIKFKALFYQQQRKIIAEQIKMISLARQILIVLVNSPQYTVIDILKDINDYSTLRKIRKYLNGIEENLPYIRLLCDFSSN